MQIAEWNIIFNENKMQDKTRFNPSGIDWNMKR